MSRPEIVEDVIAAAAAVPQALDRLSEEARAAWAGQLATDVMAERRAAGVTVAPEAALHRALQERTDELERVRAERDSALADLMESATCLEALEAERRTVLAMVEQHAGGSPRLVDEVRASLRSLAQDRDAAVDEVVRLVRERDEAQAALAEARAENASLLAVVPPGTHVARVEWGVHAEVTRQRDEILRLTRERDEARATCSELRQAVATIEAAYDRVVSERDAVRSAIREMAVTVSDHDHNADMFDSGEEELASVRAVVEEFLRAQGHPVADEWATRRFATPTAPDVGSTTSAPAAGAADPLRLSGTSRPPATWWPASDTRTRTR